MQILESLLVFFCTIQKALPKPSIGIREEAIWCRNQQIWQSRFSMPAKDRFLLLPMGVITCEGEKISHALVKDEIDLLVCTLNGL